MNPKRDPRLLTAVRAPSPKARPQGTLPLTVPSSPHVPFRQPNTRHCSLCRPLHPAAKGLDSAWKSGAPPQNPRWGWGVGRRRQTSKLQLQYAFKKIIINVPEHQHCSICPSKLCAVHLDCLLTLTQLCQGDQALSDLSHGDFLSASARLGYGLCFLPPPSSPTTQRCEKLV